MKIHKFNPLVDDKYKEMRNGDFAVAFVKKNSIEPDKPKEDSHMLWLKTGGEIFVVGRLERVTNNA